MLEAIFPHLGYMAVFLLVAGESMGVPLPGETALLVASAAAGTGALRLWAVLVCAAAGAILGDNTGYWLGRRGGGALLEQLRHRRWISPGRLAHAERFFQKHGGAAVFFGRFAAFLRIFVALIAGVARMPLRRFIFFNAAGGILWTVAVGLLGYAFGRNLARVEQIAKDAGWGLAGALGLGVAAWWIWRHWRKKRPPR